MLNNASAYHYDRAGGGYPEGIDEAVAQGFKNKSKYDRDGGAVGTVTIPGYMPLSWCFILASFASAGL